MKEYLKEIFTYNEQSPFLFTHLNFWAFFLVVLGIFACIYDKKKLRNFFLFAVSIFFYYKTGGYFFILLLFSTVTDYFIGLGIADFQTKWKRKSLLLLSILINLGVLSYFKYTYFFTDLFNQFFGTHVEAIDWLAAWANDVAGTHFDITSIILPVGISFYTFQCMSYIVDVYRKDVKPIRSIIDFGFYVTFFPPLVAGPIIRASEFVPQLYRSYQLSTREFSIAVFLILGGLIKKMLISDYISINFVDRVFDMPQLYTGFENLMAVYGYAIQIYCDFSGYTDIAIGVAMILGFQLPINFNSPYKAVNITDFWRRWHISLSRWLRDYLYIPLGGNRKGKLRTYLNLLITMLLGGLWHGANLKFILWGALHGMGLAVDKIIAKISKRPKKVSRIRRFTGIFFTFHFVCFAWIFFRAEDMHVVSQILNQIAYNFEVAEILTIIDAYRIVFIIMLFGFILHWLPANTKESVQNIFIRTPLAIKLIACSLVAIGLYQVKSADLQPFIYFQF